MAVKFAILRRSALTGGWHAQAIGWALFGVTLVIGIHSVRIERNNWRESIKAQKKYEQWRGKSLQPMKRKIKLMENEHENTTYIPCRRRSKEAPQVSLAMKY